MMHPRNLVEMLSRSVQKYPDKNAIMWKENGQYQSMNYRDLWQTINGFAEGLRQLGIRKDSKVAIFSENGPRWLISDFAILSLGAVSVPIYPTLTGKQVTFILDNADVEIAIVQKAEMVKRVTEWPSSVRHIILLEQGSSDHPLVMPFDQVIQHNAEPSSDWKNLTRDDLATIVHTSGTTGNPKGVMLTHGNLLSNVISSLYYLPVTHQDISLSFLPLSHIFERMAGHFLPMHCGATIAYAESLNTVPQNLLEVKPTLMTSVPRLYEKVYSQVMSQIESGSSLKQKIFHWAMGVAEERKTYLDQGYGFPIPLKVELRFLLAKKLVFSKLTAKLGGRLRVLVSGGAALDPKIGQFFSTIGLPIVEGYGMTECSPVISTNPITRVKPGTVGRPLPDTEVRLADDGELLVKSPSVMLGYYKQPEETAETLEDGWLHTGDIAEIDQEGYIRIVDRKKNILVLSTGKNVAPQPIESTLCTSPLIHQAVVLGNKRKYVTALIVPDYEVLLQTARQRGWNANDKESLARSAEVRTLIEQEIERMLADFASFEKPKKFAILPNEFTIEKGELTPTLKIRLKNVEKNYAALIASLYDENAESEVAATQSLEAAPNPDMENKENHGGSSNDQPAPVRKNESILKDPQIWVGIILGILLAGGLSYFFF